MAHTELRPQAQPIRIPRGHFLFSRRRVFVFIAQHKKRTKIVATRHDFWGQNVPEMLLRPGGTRSALSYPLAGFVEGRFAAGKGGNGKGGRGRESRGTDGRGGRKKEGEGKNPLIS